MSVRSIPEVHEPFPAAYRAVFLEREGDQEHLERSLHEEVVDLEFVQRDERKLGWRQLLGAHEVENVVSES